jgi:putative copper resistance protein D
MRCVTGRDKVVSFGKLVAGEAGIVHRLAGGFAVPRPISRLDERMATAAARHEVAPPALVPGEGLQSLRNAMDKAWSEFNHHWAGLLLLGMALLAVLERMPRSRWVPLGIALLMREQDHCTMVSPDTKVSVKTIV